MKKAFRIFYIWIFLLSILVVSCTDFLDGGNPTDAAAPVIVEISDDMEVDFDIAGITASAPGAELWLEAQAYSPDKGQLYFEWYEVLNDGTEGLLETNVYQVNLKGEERIYADCCKFVTEPGKYKFFLIVTNENTSKEITRNTRRSVRSETITITVKDKTESDSEGDGTEVNPADEGTDFNPIEGGTGSDPYDNGHNEENHTGESDDTGNAQQPPEIVNAAVPVINSVSPAIIADCGEEVTLFVNATSPDGGVLSYQWYKRNESTVQLIEGAVLSTYSPSTAIGGVYTYFVRVTNTNQSVNGAKTAEIETSDISVLVVAGELTVEAEIVNSDIEVTVTKLGSVVTIAAPDGYDTYNWYVDNKLSASDIKSFSIDTTSLVYGVYEIKLVAKQGSFVYSAQVYVRVQ